MHNCKPNNPAPTAAKSWPPSSVSSSPFLSNNWPLINYPMEASLQITPIPLSLATRNLSIRLAEKLINLQDRDTLTNPREIILCSGIFTLASIGAINPQPSSDSMTAFLLKLIPQDKLFLARFATTSLKPLFKMWLLTTTQILKE